MAYPFVQQCTFGEMIGRLKDEFDCEYETVAAPMLVDGDEDQCVPIHFFKRTIEGKTRTHALYIHDYEDRVQFSVVRSICDRLDIPRSAFGLTLE